MAAEELTAIALSYLEQDSLLNMDMLEPIRRGSAQIIAAQADGVLIRELNGGACMLSVDSQAAGEALAGSLQTAALFVVHQAFCIPFISQKFDLRQIMDCVQAVYPGKNLLPLNAGIEIKCLDQEWTDFIRTHYHTVDDPAYIRELLGRGSVFAAIVDGEPAGFIGLHDEGSIGLLEVLPQFKRRGIGTALESYLINLLLEKGWTPFGQIKAGNQASISLQKKLGLKVSDKHLYWLF